MLRKKFFYQQYLKTLKGQYIEKINRSHTGIGRTNYKILFLAIFEKMLSADEELC
jgi:hypothetical protein